METKRAKQDVKRDGTLVPIGSKMEGPLKAKQKLGALFKLTEGPKKLPPYLILCASSARFAFFKFGCLITHFRLSLRASLGKEQSRGAGKSTTG